jgi:hypothetical protein
MCPLVVSCLLSSLVGNDSTARYEQCTLAIASKAVYPSRLECQAALDAAAR